MDSGKNKSGKKKKLKISRHVKNRRINSAANLRFLTDNGIPLLQFKKSGIPLGFGNIGKMSKLLENLRKKMKQIGKIKKQIHYKTVKLPKQKKTGIELEEIILPSFESIRQKK